MYAVLLAYTAYTFIWSKFGLGATAIIQYTLLGLLTLGLIRYLRVPVYNKNKFINWLIILIAVQVLSWYVSGSSTTTQLKETIFILLVGVPFVSEFYDPKYMKSFMIAASVISIFMTFYSLSMIRLENENGYGGGYSSLVALPVFLYYTKRKSTFVQAVCSILIFSFVLLSMKRGDILACILALVTYFAIILHHSGKFKSKTVIAFLIIGIIGYYIFEYLLQHSSIFAWKMQQTIDGDSSGRDDIYASLYNYFINAPINIQLFGGGFDASVKIAGNRAHSDWLEVLSCEGVLGLIIYLGAFWSLLTQTIRRKDIHEKAVLASIIVIWLIKSIFSMFIYSQPTILLFILTGYILNKRIDKRYEY